LNSLATLFFSGVTMKICRIWMLGTGFHPVMQLCQTDFQVRGERRCAVPGENSLLGIMLFSSGKQSHCRRSPALRQQACSGCSRFLIQVSAYIPDHQRVFDVGNDAQRRQWIFMYSYFCYGFVLRKPCVNFA
jgi:hypothetical protein